MNRFLQRTLLSPRWQWLRPIVGPMVFSGDHQTQWLRQVMNTKTADLIERIEPHTRSTLEISGEWWNRPGLFRDYQQIDFPEYDICAGVLPTTYDLIIAEQVFEHLLWPYRAGRNVYQMLNAGGYFLITTPFLVKVHNYPTDCSRWTETGLKYFLAECGFPLETIVTGSWGNAACIEANFGPRWTIYQKWRHSLANDPDLPIVVWALARKADYAHQETLTD